MENTIKILRLETATGTGIYTSQLVGEVVEELGDTNLAYSDDRHPMPYDDAKLRGTPHMERLQFARGTENLLFGFASFAQFRAWFFSDELLKALQDKCVKFAVYTVKDSDASIGWSQCIFDCSNFIDLKVFNTIPLTETDYQEMIKEEE